MRLKKVFLLVFLFVLSMPSWGINDETQTAKNEGMRLWGLSEWIKMQPYLEQAAEKGDVESMYYLGEANRLLDRGLSHDAMDWYLQAAEHDDPYAMLRLWSGGACVAGDECPEDAEGWREKALAETLPKSEDGDAEAMLALYYIYGALDDNNEGNEWLEKAAEAGNPEAQDRLAKMIRDGYGLYWTDSRRLEAAIEWARKSAEAGYVPAMHTLAGLLREKGDNQQAWSWIVAASDAGSLGARGMVGWCYLNPDEYVQQGGLCPVDQDVVKGWAILYSAYQEVGDDTAQWVMENNSEIISGGQRKEAKAIAEDEWLNHGSPLSTFPPKYGF